MNTPDGVVFLLDCDNTLLDNDRVEEDLRDHLAREFGPQSRDRYWAILEELRGELGYADYLGALQRYRLAERFPARHYVVIDDKLRILAMTKKIWCDRVTTVFPRQGHCALDPANIAAYPAADLTVERIGDLVTLDLPAPLGTAIAGLLQQAPR